MPLATDDGRPIDIAFIGCGMMGGAMVKGLVKTGTCKAEHIVCSEIDTQRLTQLSAAVKEFEPSFAGFAPLPNGHAAQSSIVVIAVEPKDCQAVCAEIASARQIAPSEDQIFVSLAAGITLATLALWLGPGSKIARVMPNTPCVVGEMAAGYVCNSMCGASDEAIVGSMLGALGSALKVGEEADLDAVTGVSGSGPAYVFQFIEAMSDGGVRVGLSRQVATELAAKCVRGAATMVLETGRHPGALLAAEVACNG